ncbi:Lactate dehydrogenase or related 2-hydroxyacid dehydrogenase [Geosmithia morbida]|uniref:Lactate dehydrogenase or related 2-hydroxyacid dehydrogenase n=1 Tax=Geosmithia morbida TaxID=1094350 RepID=A0A9P4Z0Y7_9HYPO|nr:Lactate dehydrogenase or related 2-hydroxyacid dehydrogenase [Geosmithia morbida]KAF4125411.1 Lactate dehydrogenase or related 2-hydroxyacid dehydrogenase [Geosmithia morbida]
MSAKQDILFIDSPVQAIDIDRRRALSEKFNLLYYDCESIDEFKERLQPGGPYANLVAVVRGGWLKASTLAYSPPFTSDVVPYYPPSLRLICCSGHGHDAVDIEALTARGVWYCNTPDACTEPVANTGLALILDTFRLFTYAQWCARYDWARSRELGTKAIEPTGKILGVVGLGDIGLSIARKCEAAFDMKIRYQGPRRKPEAEKLFKHDVVYYASVDDMIPHVDCILLAAPYTRETHHLLSDKQFSLAKRGGVRIVNVARGKMIDEDALLAALEDGRVIGAGLDVHRDEPDVNPGLRENWRVTLLPHIGVCSATSWENFERINLDNVEAFFNTGKPVTPVNSIG